MLDLAIELKHEPARRGQHELAVPDPIISAAARSAGLVIPHEDTHFERVPAVGGAGHEWIKTRAASDPARLRTDTWARYRDARRTTTPPLPWRAIALPGRAMAPPGGCDANGHSIYHLVPDEEIRQDGARSLAVGSFGRATGSAPTHASTGGASTVPVGHPEAGRSFGRAEPRRAGASRPLRFGTMARTPGLR